MNPCSTLTVISGGMNDPITVGSVYNGYNPLLPMVRDT